MWIPIVGLLVGVAAATITGLAAYLAHRTIPAQSRQDYRKGSELVSGIVGTLFAISVGLVIVAAWDQVGTADQTASNEASNLVDVFWYSRSLPQDQRETLQRLATQYATSVVGEEWPLMAERHVLSDNAWNSAEQMRAFFQTIQPSSGGATTRYGQAMTRMQTVLEARRARAQMADSGVPPLLWAALGGCGLIVLLPIVAWGSPIRRVHVTMAALVGGLVGTVLFLIFQLDHPFSGGVSITPDAFQQALERFTSIRALGVS